MSGNTSDKTTAEVEKFRDMINHKPYRTPTQKEEARKTAFKGKDGAWHSTAPVSYHSQTTKKVVESE